MNDGPKGKTNKQPLRRGGNKTPPHTTKEGNKGRIVRRGRVIGATLIPISVHIVRLLLAHLGRGNNMQYGLQMCRTRK